MNEHKLIPALILGLAFVAGALVFGLFYHSAQSKIAATDILSVTGSAKARVTSDQAKLVITISRLVPVSDLAGGYSGIAHDLILANGLLKKENVPANEIVAGPIAMNQMYDQNNGSETRYQLTQTLTVQDNDVAKVTKISQAIPSLAAQGAIMSVQSLEYYYSKLPDLRVSLLSDAVKDAKARAAKIAEGTGRGIGDVQSASNGVVQVLSPNSVDISDYGSYDTSNVDKDVMVTIKASFRLK